MSGASTVALIISAVGSWGLTLFVQIAFLVVVLSTVRTRRPDVAPILLLSVALDFLFVVAGGVSQMLLPRLMLGGGNMGQYQEAQAISTLTVSLGHAVGRGLMLWGIVRLAADKPTMPT